jgi:hypothetical protein
LLLCYCLFFHHFSLYCSVFCSFFPTGT